MLNDRQREQARYDGGKEIANRKRHLAHVGTALLNLHHDCSTAGPLARMVDADDLNALAAAQRVIRAVERQLADDAREAKRIKDTHERRLEEASAAIGKLPSIAIDDIVALASIAGELSELNALVAGRYASVEIQWALRDVTRSALSWLAYKVARDQLDPAAYRESVRGEMQAHKDRHAELIQKLNTLAVAEQMEKSK